MEKYYYEEIIQRLIDEINDRKSHEVELNHRIDELMAEVVRLTQVLRNYDERAK